ncbi:inosine 5'-monophosphate dehydrogenase [compost metagenome]
MRLSLKDHMSRKLQVISEDDTVDNALHMMRNNWIRHLPVLDRNNEAVIGMISERDLLVAPRIQAPVRSIMSTPVKIFDINTPLDSIVHAMVEEKISAYLITDNEEVVGIVTSEDMLVLLEDLLNKADAPPKTVMELLMNPVLQRTMNMMSQAGI